VSDDIYRDHIKDHYANPRHWGRLDAPDIVADDDDPSCGDRVHFELGLDAAGRVERVAFEGEGCMISLASASILAERLAGRPLSELAAMTEADMLRLVAVPLSRARRRCALLPLRVVQAGVRRYAGERGAGDG